MTRIVVALVVGLLASLALLRFVPKLPFARRLILQTDLGSGPAHGSAPETDLRWLGKQGRAASQLRPAGIAEIEGERVDVVADGVLIEAGERIEVMRVDGNRIVVRRIRTETSHGEQE
jgi:membrane-bound serine protease (ClpP class)